MSWIYPEKRKLTKDDVESYAQACYDILLKTGLLDGCCKFYDPLTFKGDVAHSYVFDLWEGDRTHFNGDLRSLVDKILEETVGLLSDLKSSAIKDDNADCYGLIGFGEKFPIVKINRELLDNMSGTFDHEVINLADDMDDNEEMLTILHEAIHYLDEFLTMDMSEMEVTRMSNGLYALMKMNKNLFKDIIGKDETDL